MAPPIRHRGTVLTRWLVSLVGFAAATTIVVSSVLYAWYSRDSTRGYHELALRVLGQTARTLELLDESVKSTGFYLVQDPNVSSMMAARAEIDLYGSAVRGTLMQAMLSNPLVASIYLVNRRANLILGSPLPGNVNPRDYHRRIVALIQSQKENAIIRIDPHDTPLLPEASPGVRLLSYVFFVGRLSDPDDSFLIINIRAADVLDRIIDASRVDGQLVLVSNDRGDVVFDQDEGFPSTLEQVTTALGGILRGEATLYDPLDYRVEGRRNVLAVARSESLGYRIASVTPYSLVVQTSLDLRNRTILLSALILFAGVLSATLLARRFYRPLRELMRKYGGGVRAQAGDEFQVLDDVLQATSAKSTSLEVFVERHLPAIRDDYIDQLLDGRIELDSTGTRERLQELGVQFRHDMFQVLVLSPDGPLAGRAGVAVLRDSALSLGGQVAGGVCDCEVAIGDGESVTLVLNYAREAQPSRDALENVVRLLQQRVLREARTTVSVAIGRATPLEIRGSCENARILLGYRVKYAGGAILDDQSVATDVVGRDLFPDVEVKSLLEAIRTLSRVRTKESVHAMFERFRGYAVSDISRAILHALYATLQTIGDMARGQELRIDADLLGVYERVGRSRSLAEMERELVSFYDEVLETVEARVRRSGDTHAHVMKTAVDFVLAHYTNPDLSLERAAAEVRLNPTYLGKIFGEQLGVHFTDYVTTLRLEKARELLVGSTLTVAEVAYQVGFSSSSYFITCFRKQVGMTPARYRNLKAAQGATNG